jgi:endonuclease/exonuclease/phosphatase family metal-dependent hydrolase
MGNRGVWVFVLAAALATAGCYLEAAWHDERDESFLGGSGKADGLGLSDDSPAGRAVLRVANELAHHELDARLDRRAADSIVAGRPFQSLAELDAAYWVGPAAFARLLELAEELGWLGRRLRMATFNIRWYGLDGSLDGEFGTESRNASIRAFIDEHLDDHEVLVFQEIIDVELFRDEIMFDRTCVSYASFQRKHQFVVVCHADDVAFVPLDDEQDYRLDSINLGGFLRPGVHGKLTDLAGRPLAHLVGVHLKAGSDSTHTRVEQAEILADYTRQRGEVSGSPFIFIGDFNTLAADATGLEVDDEILLAEVLEEDGELVHALAPVRYTWRSRFGRGARLDHAWVSNNISVLDVAVPGPCNVNFRTDADTLIEYYDTVSDHCPISYDLALP